MTILIVYGTVEGQTAKIARFASDLAAKDGHEVRLFDTSGLTAPVSLEGVDAVIAAASVHERRHPKHFEVFLAAQARALSALPSLMLSVSLSAAFPEGHDEAQEYLTEMKMRTGFTPSGDMLVAGAIRGGRYDYFAMQVVRHVVLRDREVDPATTAYEFTDWDALRSRLQAFLAQGPARATG